MNCEVVDNCGGCLWRSLNESDYQKLKIDSVKKILAPLGEDVAYNRPIFIKDGCRRRAALTFRYHKKNLILGFNKRGSDEVINLNYCPLLTPKLNTVLTSVRQLLTELCAVPYSFKKGKKIITQTIATGDVWLCEAENGIDVVLEYDAPLELNHRMILFEQVQTMPEVIRLSHRRKNNDIAEPIIEKSKPYIKMGLADVFIPAGTFLQPSQEGQQVLTDLVLRYLGTTEGKIADLFCGVGTFSYALAQNIHNKILAVDSSAELLKGFRESVNANRIPNIEIQIKNLFKYPLSQTELKDFAAVVLDPPRAGASAQVNAIAALSQSEQPSKVIMVSCNPHSFVKDAILLTNGGYLLQEVTIVDQFIYSNHSELVALFTKEES